MRLYTETAFHHEGDFDFLIQLIDASRDAGADGVKFQILSDANNLISSRHSGYATLSQYIFTEKQWRTAFDHAVASGLRLVTMPLDMPSLKLIAAVEQHVAYQEIHPVCLNDLQLLDGVRASRLPLIIGIGGRTLDEIDHWQAYFGAQLTTLMCGFQAFPSRLEDVKLERIPLLKARYPGLTIGYADHSGFADPDAVASNATAWKLGARLFEKHITVTEGQERVDYESALGPEKIAEIAAMLAQLAQQPEDADTVAASDIRLRELMEMSDAEKNYRKRTKVAVANADLRPGHVLTEDDLALKMMDREGGYFDLQSLVGRTLATAIPRDELITTEDLGS